MFRKRTAVLVALSVAILGASPLLAAPIYFTDRAAFNAAAGVLNFEGFEADFAVAPTVAFPGFTVSETNGIDALAQLRNFPGLMNGITGGTGALAYDDNGTSIGTFFAFTGPVTAFGLDITSDEAGTMTIGGSASYSLGLAGNVPAFWGVIDIAGLNFISFDMSGGPNIAFDSASYGLAEPVPEPASLLLLGTGLATVAMRFRRRRRG